MGRRGHGWERRQLPLTLIDQFTLAAIQAGKQFDKRIKLFYWRLHSELAYQRSEVLDKIHKTLLASAVENWKFKNWQRTVKVRWLLKPLSAGGSLASPGGRFNIGEIESTFPTFPALYVASDKETALQEVLGQDQNTKGGLTSYEVALKKPDSIAFFSMSGCVQTVIDLGQPDRLEPFLHLIKEFRLSPDLSKLGRELAKDMKLPPPRFVITTLKELLPVLLAPNWRELPIQIGVPSTSQIFGQLVVESGVEGIVYSSKFNDHPCAVIFPQAFAGSSSYVALDDDQPRKDVIPRLDRDTWPRLCK